MSRASHGSIWKEAVGAGEIAAANSPRQGERGTLELHRRASRRGWSRVKEMGWGGRWVRRAVRTLRTGGLLAMVRNLDFIPDCTEKLLEGFRQGSQSCEMIYV